MAKIRRYIYEYSRYNPQLGTSVRTDEVYETTLKKDMEEQGCQNVKINAYKAILVEGYFMRKYCKFYTSVKSGITMSFKGWLQLISQKEFGRELCMTAPSLWEPVIARFNEYKQNGTFVPAVKEAK